MAHKQTQPRSPLAWVGGKSKLTHEIIPLIPPHRCYVEVFAGAAWVLFRKPRSKSEVINDINSELVTFYRVIKHHRVAFVEAFNDVLTSRDEFNRFIATPPQVLTDIQRAVRFYYMLRNTFGAKVIEPSFVVSNVRGARISLEGLNADIAQASARLERVYIDNVHYERLIRRVDHAETFFYLDPPYWDCENVYGKGIFSKDDFTRLRDLLATVKGKWLMSINDTPQIRALFGDYHLREVATQYSINDGPTQPVTELLIANYSLTLGDD